MANSSDSETESDSTDSNSEANSNSDSSSDSESSQSSESESISKFNSENSFIISPQNKGICLIFRYRKFKHEYRPFRRFPKKDITSLRNTFEQLNFEIKTFDFCRLKKLTKILSTDDYSKFSCVAIFFLKNDCYHTFELGLRIIKSEQIINLVTKNESLRDKPKLVFINCTPLDDAPSEDELNKNIPETIQTLPYPDLFVFYSTNQRINYSDIWFIQKMCNLLKTRAKCGFDLLTLVTQIIKETRRNELELNPMDAMTRLSQQSPIYSSTLSKLVVFETDASEPDMYPDRGRCIILNYSRELDINKLEETYFRKYNFHCKQYSHEYLYQDFDKTLKILKRESTNSTKHCKCLVIFIFAKCDPQSVSFTRHITITARQVLKYFKAENTTYESKKLQKYIFINSSSQEIDNQKIQPFYYCKRDKNIFISYNTRPVNQSIQTIKNYNYPPNQINSYLRTFVDRSKTENNEKTQILPNHVLIDHSTNSMEWNSGLVQTRFKESVYETCPTPKGTCVIVNYSKNYDKAEKIKNIFLSLKFDVLPKTYSELKEYLKHNIKNTKRSCFVCFVLAKNANKKVDELVYYFKNGKSAEYLKDIPKLIFIQNFSGKNASVDIHLDEDFLLLTSSALNSETTFVDTFCPLLDENCDKNDVMSILHQCNIEMGNSLSIKSTLTKTLFLHKPLSTEEIELIQNDDVYYKINRKRCHFMIFKNAIQNFAEWRQLKEGFKKLKFQISKEITNNKLLKQMLSNDMLRSHRSYDGFFLFIILDGETESDIIFQLVEHLTDVETLFGKPKVLFLLGPFKNAMRIGRSCIVDKKFKLAKKFSLSKHADLMMFHSEYVSDTLKSICHIFGNENVNKYDLMQLLLMVADHVKERLMTLVKNDLKRKNEYEDSNITKKIKNDSNSEHQRINQYPTNQAEKNQLIMKAFSIQNYSSVCISSTLTRLINMTNLKIQDELSSANKIDGANPEPIHGKCFIFNYKNFLDEPKKERTGTDIDRDRLKSTFKKFEIADLKSDMDKGETEKIINNSKKL